MDVEHTREFHFTEQDFSVSVRRISLCESKREQVSVRVARRLRAAGAKTFTEYLDRLQRGDKAEWEAFANSLIRLVLFMNPFALSLSKCVRIHVLRQAQHERVFCLIHAELIIH